MLSSQFINLSSAKRLLGAMCAHKSNLINVIPAFLTCFLIPGESERISFSCHLFRIIRSAPEGNLYFSRNLFQTIFLTLFAPVARAVGRSDNKLKFFSSIFNSDGAKRRNMIINSGASKQIESEFSKF